MEVLVGVLVLCFVVLALVGGSRPTRRRSGSDGSHVSWFSDGGWGGDGGGCGGGDGGGC